jgi:hypothetical protein
VCTEECSKPTFGRRVGTVCVYSLAIAPFPRTGLYTDPQFGACTNASDPTSLQCAYGSGDACRPCPAGALCPGGYRVWPRPGYYAPSETADAVVPCEPPDPLVRCTGWNASVSATQCGAGYLQGSYTCSACAPGFFLADDGRCSQCPILGSLWQRYSSLVYIVVAIFVVVIVVYLCLVLLVFVKVSDYDPSRSMSRFALL